MKNNSARKEFAAKISVISNTTLVILKIIAGIISGSVGILSEAIHSGIDLGASLVAYYSIRIASVPEDKDHPYGHGKYEDISGLAEAILIFLVSILIVREAVLRLMGTEAAEIQTMFAIVVMIISTLTNIFVSQYLFKVAKETDSIALLADAQHLMTDVYTSITVLISLIIIEFTGFIWVDAVSAILIACFIAYIAYKLTKKAIDNLVDIALPKEEEEKIKNIIYNYSDEIVSLHKFRSRKSGSNRFVDFHMMIDGKLTIAEGHLLCDLIEDDIKKYFPGSKISIHIEPCEDDCTLCHIFKDDPDSCKHQLKMKALEQNNG